MVNDVGTTLVNSLTNSTFDIGNMSKVLAEAEVAGARATLERNQTKVSTELEAIKYLETNLVAFNTYLSDLSSPDLFGQKTAQSSDENVVTVSATVDAALASYQIESRQLAQSHTLVNNKTYNSASDTISNGTLTIAVGGQTHDITVDNTNNTLEGLQNVINSGDYGITASIINNAGDYQMMFTSKESGASGEISLSGLTDFDTSGFTTTAEAQDAVMVLNGLTVTSESNQFDSVIEGVTFNLNSAAAGSPKTVSVGQNTEQVSETITSFVDVYNQMHLILGELGNYDKSDLTEAELESEEYQYYGDLAGSGLLRSVQSQIRDSLVGAIDEIDGAYNNLASIGITLDREGQLELDSSTLNSVLASDMQAVSNLLSKGGSSDDPLVNVIGGTDRTQTGNYALDITQLAERAAVTGGAATFTGDERVAAGRVYDSTAALTLEATAAFDLTIGATTQSLNLAGLAGTYSSKADVATAIQGEIDTAFGAGVANISYDATQSRYEVTSAVGQGAASINNATGLSNQGFSASSYTGEALMDLTTGASFDVVVDASTSSTVNLTADRYSLNELSKAMADAINANTDVIAAGAGVSVTNDGSALTLSSNLWGALSNIELTNVTNLGNSGLIADSDAGQSVDGTLTTESGTLNIGAYTSSEDGRIVNISDFAMVGTIEAEVRGLEFEVLGGTIGARGDVQYAQGFASLLEQTVNDLFDEDNGLIGQRIDSLNAKMDDYEENTTKIDARYEKMLFKYQMQFATLQSIMSSSQQTRDYLTATFSNNNNN